MKQNFPRIVMISMTSLSCSNATGSLLSTLFQNWPHKDILQISTNIPEDEVTSSYTHFFRPRGDWDIPLFKALFPQTKIGGIYCANWKSLLNTVRRFNPEILYTRIVGSPLFFTDISYKLSQQLNIPTISHIMDDYEGLFSSSPNLIERYFIKTVFVRRFRKIISISKKNYAISPKMAEAFTKRYNKHFTTLHNGIDPLLWTQQQKNENNHPSKKGKTFRLVLAGALAPEKEGAIAKPLAQAVARLNSEGERKYELILNIQDYFLPFAQQLAAQYHGTKTQAFLPIQEYRQLLQNADLLILARNFDIRSRAYTQYSFQNKLPEYMASGSPILCIGPRWENSIQFLKINSAGEILTEYSPHKIQNTIRMLQQNRQKRIVLAEKSKQIAFSQFNINTIREGFQQTIFSLARRP